MKKLLFILIVLLSLAFPKATTKATTSFTYIETDYGSYKGKPLNRGPKGGCYYINKNGNKTYVERSLCKC